MHGPLSSSLAAVGCGRRSHAHLPRCHCPDEPPVCAIVRA
ncbi:hypothetical protein HMPREF9946_00572 [Acetobacteraceae bacterium AT-5844]|nr:hypothetical protein HMPREF9946_00572 [Acetobacteraceae bacterium AT-5844]